MTHIRKQKERPFLFSKHNNPSKQRPYQETTCPSAGPSSPLSPPSPDRLTVQPSPAPVVSSSTRVSSVPASPSTAPLHIIDLESTTPCRALNPSPALSHVPEPRVGATAVYDTHTNSLYVWGGRGGVNMAPLDRFQAGIWKIPLDALDSADTVPWQRLPSVNDDSDAAPPLRSFHASVLAGGKIYIHAGCPESGRLSDLHAYDLATHTWHKLADAPTQPRGGTAIAAVSLSSTSEPVLIRFGGRSDMSPLVLHSQDTMQVSRAVQLPQVTDGAPPPLDIYTPSTDTWSTVYPVADPEHGFPGSRSVHGLVPFTAAPAVALLYHGERDASSLGHAGAGVFWDDAWLLLTTSSPSTLQWKKLRVTGDAAPDPRGWFAPASYVSGGKTRIVLSGGLLSSNERSDQVWVGDVEL
ncbi:galactose oxidase [Lanmaoa asiatica]|nr:galactose oxidase [Lanmaoa asiatica]